MYRPYPVVKAVVSYPEAADPSEQTHGAPDNLSLIAPRPEDIAYGQRRPF